MAKGGISKKRKAPSIHSRTARRATSPSIDTDKSLKNVQPPAESVDYRPSVLAIHQGAGVSKKAKKGKVVSTRARRRQEKAQDRAAAVVERTEKKVAKSRDQARLGQSRSKTWDDINKQVPPVDNKNPFAGLGIVDEEEEDSELDEEMDEAQIEDQNEGSLPKGTAAPTEDGLDEEIAAIS